MCRTTPVTRLQTFTLSQRISVHALLFKDALVLEHKQICHENRHDALIFVNNFTFCMRIIKHTDASMKLRTPLFKVEE